MNQTEKDSQRTVTSKWGVDRIQAMHTVGSDQFASFEHMTPPVQNREANKFMHLFSKAAQQAQSSRIQQKALYQTLQNTRTDNYIFEVGTTPTQGHSSSINKYVPCATSLKDGSKMGHRRLTD